MSDSRPLPAAVLVTLATTTVWALTPSMPHRSPPELASPSLRITPGAALIPGARWPQPQPPWDVMPGAADDSSASARKKARKDWFAQMHRTSPGVDWRALERDNGRRSLARRNALAEGTLPPDTLPPDTLDARWQERGSDNQAGRTHSAAVSPDGDQLYVGSALGGVWRGELDGTGWAPLGDNLYGGAHQLLVSAGDTAGDPDIMLAASSWSWLHVSEDDGATWQEPSGLPGVWRVVRLRKASDEDAAVYTIIDNGYTATLSRSDDGGRSFTTVRELGAFPGSAGGWNDDVWVPRDGDSTVYAVVDGVVEVSTDDGETWEVRGSPLAGAEDDIQSLYLAGSEAGAPTLYLAVQTRAGSALHRSDDGGWTWTVAEPTMDDFWGALEASVVDADLVVWGGVEAYRSTDGGASHTLINAWGQYYGDPAHKLHADIMGIQATPDPEDPDEELWFINTDGGSYISEDGAATVDNLALQGLRISQYYDVLTSSVDPNHIAAGAQDQGYQLTTGLDQDDAVLQFTQAISGDYGHLTSGDGSHSFVHSVYPGVMLTQEGEDEPVLHFSEFPRGATMGWLPMVVADPTDPEAVFLCADQLHRYRRTDTETWTPEVFSDQDFGARSGEYLSALAFAPSQPDQAYAVTSHGALWSSTDGAVTWAESESTAPSGHYFYGNTLVVDNLEPKQAWVGGTGYEGAAVYRTDDGGQTWTPWGDGLPETLVYTLVQLRDGSGRIVAGTETGAWMRGPDDSAWADITAHPDGSAPVTLYWSAEVLAHDNTVRFATYGRGLWDLQLPMPDHCYPVEDGDGDGLSCDVDCDDADPERFVGAADVCGDGIDQDCDGVDAPCGDDTADDAAPTEDDADEGKDAGCGCAAGGGAGGWLLLFPAALLLARRNQS